MIRDTSENTIFEHVRHCGNYEGDYYRTHLMGPPMSKTSVVEALAQEFWNGGVPSIWVDANKILPSNYPGVRPESVPNMVLKEIIAGIDKTQLPQPGSIRKYPEALLIVTNIFKPPPDIQRLVLSCLIDDFAYTQGRVTFARDVQRHFGFCRLPYTWIVTTGPYEFSFSDVSSTTRWDTQELRVRPTYYNPKQPPQEFISEYLRHTGFSGDFGPQIRWIREHTELYPDNTARCALNHLHGSSQTTSESNILLHEGIAWYDF